jgi:hypothetical protein
MACRIKRSSISMLVRIPFAPLMCKDTTFLCITQRYVIEGEMNLLGSELPHRVYATHVILSLLRFFAQSAR